MNHHHNSKRKAVIITPSVRSNNSSGDLHRDSARTVGDGPAATNRSCVEKTAQLAVAVSINYFFGVTDLLNYSAPMN